MKYEALLEEADRNFLTVVEVPLHASNGRINGNRIAISKNIETSTEKACILAEELGHHHTTVGNILDLTDARNRKQERQARLWAYNELIGLYGLIKAYEARCRDWHEVAEYLEVTEEFLTDAVACFRDKYGTCATVDNYIIFFIPHMMVGKMIK